jgi:hypothetical protein
MAGQCLYPQHGPVHYFVHAGAHSSHQPDTRNRKKHEKTVFFGKDEKHRQPIRKPREHKTKKSALLTVFRDKKTKTP